jgi:outer membrane protein assembly factor BamA
MVKTLACIVLCFLISEVFCQQESDTILGRSQSKETSDSSYKLKIIALPVVFYTPETRLGFGAAAAFSFRAGNSSENRFSQLNIGGAYTLERQILSYVGYDIWLNNDAIVLNGELGYYRFYYYFWGIGEEPRKQEQFGMTLPKFRLEAYHRIQGGFYAGVKIRYEDVTITETDPAGRLSQPDYAVGLEGGRMLGVGLTFKYDTRNHNFYPTTGYNIYGNVERFSPKLGSEFNFTTLWLNAKRYFDLKNDRVLAANLFGRMSFGEVPFFQLSQVGGENRMRGYYEGFHRDHHMLGWQMEYRTPVPIPRVYVAVFYANAVVADQFSHLKWRNILTTLGAGIRIDLDRQRKIHGRYDFAFSRETTGSYLTLGEAY